MFRFRFVLCFVFVFVKQVVDEGVINYEAITSLLEYITMNFEEGGLKFPGIFLGFEPLCRGRSLFSQFVSKVYFVYFLCCFEFCTTICFSSYTFYHVIYTIPWYQARYVTFVLSFLTNCLKKTTKNGLLWDGSLFSAAVYIFLRV